MKKSAILVLGSGRSGTSLLTECLFTMGIQLSDNLIPAGIHNKRGFFEDAEIVRIHKEILIDYGNPYLLPLNFRFDAPHLNKYKSLLFEIVKSRISKTESDWAMKDPRTSSFLPLWQSLFAKLDVQVHNLLIVRHPTSVISSMAAAGIAEEITELIWLKRNLDTIMHTEGNLCIIHYEDFFTMLPKVVKNICQYIGINNDKENNNLIDKVSAILDDNLNNQPFNNNIIENKIVKQLYENLRDNRWCVKNKQLFNEAKKINDCLNQKSNWYESKRISCKRLDLI